MIKRLTEWLNLITAAGQALPYVIAAGAFIGVVLKWLAGTLWAASVQLRFPLLLVIAIVSLAIYPLAKLLEWVVKKDAAAPFEYSGVLWRPSRLSFRYPTALCLQPSCGRELFHKSESKQSVEQGQHGWDYYPKLTTTHFLECPEHGRVWQGDSDLDELRAKARSMQKSNKRS
ncbi:MAG TPA: hypothetical protein VF784_01085 [Anaerolineales bacterium]